MELSPELPSPLVIMPKYLWNEIYSYLPYKDHYKLFIVHSNFTLVVLDDLYKDAFMNRSDSIAIVKTIDDNTKMRTTILQDQYIVGPTHHDMRLHTKHFWLCALLSYDAYDDINTALDAITASRNISSDKNIRYKVFMKAGLHYNRKFGLRDFHGIYSIELIGSAISITEITFGQSVAGHSYSNIVVQMNLSFKNITFRSMRFRFSLSTMYIIEEMKQSKYIPCKAAITIEHCKFIDSTIYMSNVHHIIISNCEFIVIPNSSTYTITSLASSAVIDINNSLDYKQKPYYNMTTNIFANIDTCCKLLLHDRPAEFSFCKNVIKNVKQIMELRNCGSVNIVMEDNCMNDVDALTCNYESEDDDFVNGNPTDGLCDHSTIESKN